MFAYELHYLVQKNAKPIILSSADLAQAAPDTGGPSGRVQGDRFVWPGRNLRTKDRTQRPAMPGVYGRELQYGAR
ncbi:MAG: hypothetical protein ACK4LB_15770 [Spirosomataceae bacterium]